MRIMLSMIVAALVPWAMGQGAETGASTDNAVPLETVMHVDGEREVEKNVCRGLYLIAHVLSDVSEKKSVVSPETIHRIVSLAKETGCTGVGIAGVTADQTAEQNLREEAGKARVAVVNENEIQARIDLRRKNALPTAQQAIRQLQEAIARGKQALTLDLAVDVQGVPDEKCMQLLRRVGHWMQVNNESVSDVMPTNLELPEDWKATTAYPCSGDTYLLCPVMHPNENVTLKIPAHLIDTVKPEVIGQPEQTVEVRRVEEPGQDEPHAFMLFTIPAAIWDQAVEGLPVIKLINTQ